jgi:hypothetical protein
MWQDHNMSLLDRAISVLLVISLIGEASSLISVSAQDDMGTQVHSLEELIINA